MKNTCRFAVMVVWLLLIVNTVFAQNIKKDTGAVIRKIVTSPGNDVYVSSFKGFVMMGNKPYADRLLSVIRDYIYLGLYNNSALLKNGKPCFTILRADVDRFGKAARLRFSDSADTLLLREMQRLIKQQDINPVIAEYAKVKGYRETSLFIPVMYEPNEPDNKERFTYNEAEALFKFDKKIFEGPSVILPVILVPLLSAHNF